MLEFLNSNVISSLAAALFHSLWQAGLLYFILRIYKAFRPGNSPRFLYGLGLGALLIFSIINGLTYGLLISEGGHGQSELLSHTANQNLQRLPVDVLSSGNTGLMMSGIIPYFIIFWWLGIVLFTIRFALNLRRTNRLAKTGLIEPPKDILDKFVILLRRMKVTRTAKIYLSKEVFSPAVIGVFKPLVLLPVGLVNGLSVEEVEAILIHELNHIRRHDYLVNIMQSMLEIMYFFNPFVWLISNEIREQRENACDDKALTTGISRRSYAEMLANIYEFAYRKQNMAISLAERRNLTLKRIRRIMKTRSNNNRLTASLFLVLAITSALYFGAETTLATDNSSLYSPERLQIAGPFGSVNNDELSEALESFSQPLILEDKIDVSNTVADTIDEKELARKALEYEAAMEKLHSTKEWQELEALRKEMLSEQIKVLKELSPQIEEALRSVKAEIKIDEVEMEALREQMANLKVELNEVEMAKEVSRAMEQSAKAIKESMARIEAEIAVVEAAELQEMAQQFAVQAMESAADAELLTLEAEKVADEAMKVARKVEKFMLELKSELVNDGYLKKSEDLKDLKFDEGKVVVNGKEVKTRDAKKYYELRKKHLGEDAEIFSIKN